MNCSTATEHQKLPSQEKFPESCEAVILFFFFISKTIDHYKQNLKDFPSRYFFFNKKQPLSILKPWKKIQSLFKKILTWLKTASFVSVQLRTAEWQRSLKKQCKKDGRRYFRTHELCIFVCNVVCYQVLHERGIGSPVSH